RGRDARLARRARRRVHLRRRDGRQPRDGQGRDGGKTHGAVRERHPRGAGLGGSGDPQHFSARDRYLRPVRRRSARLEELIMATNTIAKSEMMGLHSEQLAGRTQHLYFSAEEAENFTYPGAFEVDFAKEAEFDAAPLSIHEINLKLRELMSQGFG